MPEHQVDAFFTIANAGQGIEQTGFVVRGDRAARYGWVSGRMLDGAVPLARRWPGLPAVFRAGFDAALTLPSDDPWTLVFRGTQCLRLHPLEGSVAEVTTIAARFPGLPAGFGSGIDAALPGPTGSQVFLFRGNQCVLYDTRIPAVVETESLAEMWSGLQAKAPAFVNGISAATYDPSKGEFHLFRGMQYTKGVLATRTVTANAAAIDESSWPGLVPTFAPGHVYVSHGSGRPLDIVDVAAGKVSGNLDIRVASDAAKTLAVSPDGRHLYVRAERSWVCLDTTTHRVLARTPEIATGLTATNTGFSADGRFVHGVLSVEQGPIYLDTYPVGSAQRTRRIEIRAGDLFADPAEAAKAGSLYVFDSPLLSVPGGRHLYFGGSVDGNAVVIEVDDQSGLVRQGFRIPGSQGVEDLAVSPDGLFVHVATRSDVATVDVRNGNIRRQGVLPVCENIALTPDGLSLYCLPEADKSGILVVDPVDHSVRYRIPVGGQGGLGTPHGIAFDFAGTYAFVGERESMAVSIVDTAEHVLDRAIPVAAGGWPRAIAFTVY
ncbi:hypothetical protein [Embleya scabrispora]|uniref:hypothetical protein n=1 Tax=Embleya scabrispora TaxID=159449 RepID=UPI00039F16CA|nr:hypothetical protein [Embleya scabrispora]MYS78884.1 hypothetical protein [Streptomyces sp. SID5474]